MSDQGESYLAQGCTQCGIWKGDKRIRPAFIITERHGHSYWTCPMCDGSYAEVTAPQAETLAVAEGFVLVPADLMQRLRHYTDCYLQKWPSCGAPTEAEVDEWLAAAPTPTASIAPKGEEAMDAESYAELFRLREAVKGPPGFATWQDAATDERIRRVKAERALAAPKAEGEAVKWGYAKTVGNAIAQLRTLDPALPFYAAMHLQDGRCIARGVTISRERVVNDRWIDSTRDDVPYSLVVWSQQEQSPFAAPVAQAAVGIDRLHEAALAVGNDWSRLINSLPQDDRLEAFEWGAIRELRAACAALITPRPEATAVAPVAGEVKS